MKKILLIGLCLLLVIISSYIVYMKIFRVKIDVNNNVVEINTEHQIKEFIKSNKNIKLQNGDEVIIFDKLGKKKVTAIFKNKLNKKFKYDIEINVVDTIQPEIEYNEKITITEGEKVDLLKDIKVTDNSNEKITPEVIGEYDTNKKGNYELHYKAKDSSGNEKLVAFTLIVKEKKSTNTSTKTTSTNKNKYYIKVNKTLNVVIVYGLDENNEYTKVVKTFVASAGNNTPTGIFTTDIKAETLSLEGGVWGHYTVRFLKSRGMWFHSVPYFSKPTDGHWNDLEFEEYNKLGTLASKGCIRLAVIDAKWIYQNISNGTTVEIYESDTLPEGVIKPTPIKIDVNSENRGWDPTDPDSLNPWNN